MSIILLKLIAEKSRKKYYSVVLYDQYASKSSRDIISHKLIYDSVSIPNMLSVPCTTGVVCGPTLGIILFDVFDSLWSDFTISTYCKESIPDRHGSISTEQEELYYHGSIGSSLNDSCIR